MVARQNVICAPRGIPLRKAIGPGRSSQTVQCRLRVWFTTRVSARHSMQLRVARLCLDCEELHVEDSCPVCASERYAHLTAWLPVEERRRWRRPPPKAAHRETGRFRAVKRLLAWFGIGESVEPFPRLRTRASDSVPRLDFDEPVKAPETRTPEHEKEMDSEVVLRKS